MIFEIEVNGVVFRPKNAKKNTEEGAIYPADWSQYNSQP